MAKYTPVKQHNPVDENVQVPAAIRAAAARSAELHKQAYEEEPPANANEPVAEPPVSQDATAGTPAGDTPADPPQETPPAGEGENWEAKFKTMKGRYEKTITGLNSRIANLESLLAKPETPPVQPRTPDLTFKPVTKDEIDNYGEEFIDVATRAAAEKLVPEIASLKAELASLKGTVTSVATRTEEDAVREMYKHMDGEMPDWRKLNRDPKFLAWANLPDPFSGAIRVAMMRDAFAKADGPRVLRFFQGFLSDEAATGPATTQTEPPTAGKVPLETFAAPGRAKAPAASVQPQAPGEKEPITHAEIAQFYLNVQKGVYRGNEAEKDRLERMIFDAQADGRVI